MNFGAYVEIRAGRVSRYEYSLMVENNDFTGPPLMLNVLGSNRAAYPGEFGYMRTYDDIAVFGTRMPSNRQKTHLFVAFTPVANPEDIRNSFDVRLQCVWGAHSCSATKQLLPILWQQKIEPDGPQ